MARIAIHPETLDLREFKPGMGLQAKGYIVVKDAEDMYAKGVKTFLPALIAKLKAQPAPGAKPLRVVVNKVTCIKIWPDVVVRALNNIKALVENDKAKAKGVDINGDEPPMKTAAPVNLPPMGRGNHVVRLPSFKLTGRMPTVRVPPQAEVVAMEFKKLFDAGKTEIKKEEMSKLVSNLAIPTNQTPARIFRYYFWLLVRAGVFVVEGEYFMDVVVRQNAIRFGFDPQLPVESNAI